MIPKARQEFERYLTLRLCWIDGTPTHKSSKLQRQCPKCRRKWSYARHQLRWSLAKQYASGKSALEASRETGTAYSTAWTVYKHLDHRAPRFLKSAMYRAYKREPKKYIADIEGGGLKKIEQLQALNRASTKAKRLLFLKLPMEERLRVVFEAFCQKLAEENFPPDGNSGGLGG